MKWATKDIEKQFGINRKTLFFYEEEGLLHPERKENGYREYGDEDVERLKTILLLRGMDVSLAQVKKYLDNEVTVQEILREQSEKMRLKKEEYEKKEQEALYLKDREMPLLDYGNLLDVNQAKGRRIALCSRKMKKDYVSLFWKVPLFILAFGFICLAGYNNVIRGSVSLYLYSIPVIILILVYFLISIHQEPFLEFTDTGIVFYRGGNIMDDLRHFIAVICNKEEDGLHFVPYEKITEVRVRTRKQYFKFWSYGYFPQELYTFSISFAFQEEKPFTLRFPYTMENDQRLFSFVLLSKVKNINDPDHVLNILAEGKDLTEQMQKQQA